MQIESQIKMFGNISNLDIESIFILAEKSCEEDYKMFECNGSVYSTEHIRDLYLDNCITFESALLFKIEKIDTLILKSIIKECCGEHELMCMHWGGDIDFDGTNYAISELTEKVINYIKSCK